jgi:hypothetical protein
MLLLVGCYELHHGRYVAEKAKGWAKWEDVGSNFFRYPTKDVPNWYIQIGGNHGILGLRIGSNAYDPARIWNFVSFSNNPISIIFHDENRQTSVPLDGFKSPDGSDLNVGESKDFTVIIPSFKIGENTIPELSARFHWSNEKYRIWVPLQ